MQKAHDAINRAHDAVGQLNAWLEDIQNTEYNG
jgi:hypothetical protein